MVGTGFQAAYILRACSWKCHLLVAWWGHRDPETGHLSAGSGSCMTIPLATGTVHLPDTFHGPVGGTPFCWSEGWARTGEMESGEDRWDSVFSELISLVQSIVGSSLLVLLGQSWVIQLSLADLSSGDVLGTHYYMKNSCKREYSTLTSQL